MLGKLGEWSIPGIQRNLNFLSIYLVHLGFDALLISAFLAGVKRTTGLTYVPRRL